MLLGRGAQKKQRRGRPRSKSAPAVLVAETTVAPKKKRKQWSDQSMCLAMEAVKKGGSSITHAATLHGVPRQTLQDRISGKVRHGDNPGPRPFLSS